MSYQLLKEKINFNLSKKYDEKIQSLIQLECLTEQIEDSEDIASHLYELAKMNHKLGRDNIGNEYKEKAIILYKELSEKHQKTEYEVRLKELKNL